MKTTTARTLALLRKRGYLCQPVEQWNAHAMKRRDLWGFGDVLALRGAETLLVQCTSGSNVSARISKIETHENFRAVLDAGWLVVVHGWVKRKGRWQCREEWVTG